MSSAIEFINTRSSQSLKKLLVDLSRDMITLDDLESLLIFSKEIGNWHINYLVCKNLTQYITSHSDVSLFHKIANQPSLRTEAITISTIYLNQLKDFNSSIIQAILKLAAESLSNDLHTLQLYDAISNKLRNTEISFDFTVFMELEFPDPDMKRKHYSLMYDISKHFHAQILPKLSYYEILLNPKDFSPSAVILSLRAVSKSPEPELISKFTTPNYVPELFETLLEDDEYLVDSVIYLLDLQEDISAFELLPNNLFHNYLDAIGWDVTLLVDYILTPETSILDLLLKISSKIFYTNPYSIYIYFDELHEERRENNIQFLSSLYSKLASLYYKKLIPYDISPLLNKLVRYTKYT